MKTLEAMTTREQEIHAKFMAMPLVPQFGNQEVLTSPEIGIGIEIESTGADGLHTQSMHQEPNYYLDEAVKGEDIAERLLTAFSSTKPDADNQSRIDAYSLIVNDQDINVLHTGWDKKNRKKQQMRDRYFDRLGNYAEVIFTNLPPKGMKGLVSRITMSGRNHIKGADIWKKDENGNENHVFYFGGTNFEELTASFADFMVRFTGKKAKQLSTIFSQIQEGKITQDAEIPLDDETSIFVDGGNPGKSIILDTAVSLINGAKSNVQNTTMFSPDGRIAAALAQKHSQGVNVEVVTSRIVKPKPSRALTVDTVMYALHLFNSAKLLLNRHKIPVQKNQQRTVHAKLLLIDDKTALFGTHNLSAAGVKLGTQEWAMLTRNTELVANLKRMYYDIKAESNPHLAEVL